MIEYVPYDGHRCIHELFNCTPEHADHFEHDLYKSLDETTAIEVAVNLYTIHDLYNHLTKLRIEFPHITKVLLDFDFTSYKSLSYRACVYRALCIGHYYAGPCYIGHYI